MIQNHKLNFTFIHNPKCGGTTVREALKRISDEEDFFWMFETKTLPFGGSLVIDKAHIPIDYLRFYYPESYKFLISNFSFCFVRHPIHRLISAYLEFDQNFNGVSKKNNSFQRLRNFKAYIDRRLVAPSIDHKTIHCLPQHRFFLAKNKKIPVILRIEKWIEDLDKIADYNIYLADLLKNCLEEKKKNSSGNIHEFMWLWKELTLERKILVTNYYEDDFKILNYPIP